MKKITATRKKFYKRLFFIGLGIIPIIILLNNKGTERFIALAGFLFSMYNLILIIQNIKDTVDDFIPPKTYKEPKTKLFDKIIYYLTGILFIGSLLFELFEINKIDNTIDGLGLFWLYGLSGLFFSILLIFIFRILSPSIYNESDRRLTIILGLPLAFFLISPALACFINQKYSQDTIIYEDYIINRKGSNSTKNHEYYLYLNIKKDTERFIVKKEFWEQVDEKQIVRLETKKGFLGYKYVIDFIRI